MFGLLRAVGTAVVLGMGARAGSELFDMLRERAKKRQAESGEAGHDGEPPAEESEEAAEERLKAERERINRELERLRRKRAKKS